MVKNDNIDELLASELTSIEGAITRVQELLQLNQKITGLTSAPIQWNTAQGLKGEYEWINPRQNPELATRLQHGPLISDGYSYWLADNVGVIMRRKQ